MLLEFRVGNYRSIRDEQVLSLVAAQNDKELLSTHVASTDLKSVRGVVRSAVVYGPNASGKSTLLNALNYMRGVVVESATLIQPGQSYNVQNFRLDDSFAKLPTTFEISFLLNGVRHQYTFAMDTQRIVSESLLVYKTSKPTKWFSRKLQPDGFSYDYEYSPNFTGSRKLWQESTRDNALFLSTAAQLNSELLGPVFRWIAESIYFIPAGAIVSHDLTTSLLSSEEGKESIREFLSSADISIANVHATPRKGPTLHFTLKDGGISHSTTENEILMPLFEHVTSKGSAKFELHEESEGTQRWYGLVAPILDVLNNGKVLLVDELDGSLHALLVRRLLSMFHSQDNKRGAQLIFSTHDTSLLDHTLFRRDQIWFTEKDADQATCLYPLTDFSPRKREAWDIGYLSGRYGAVPFFSGKPNIQKYLNLMQPKDAG